MPAELNQPPAAELEEQPAAALAEKMLSVDNNDVPDGSENEKMPTEDEDKKAAPALRNGNSGLLCLEKGCRYEPSKCRKSNKIKFTFSLQVLAFVQMDG